MICPFSFAVENPRIVAPALCAATVFSTAGGRSERLIFFSWADAPPASSSPPAAITTNRFTFMFPPERGGQPPMRRGYALVSKHRINDGGVGWRALPPPWG